MWDESLGFMPKDYLDAWEEQLEAQKIRELREERMVQLPQDRFRKLREATMSIADLETKHLDFSGPAVRLGSKEDLNDEQRARLDAALKAYCPWKKGPFELFGTYIDTEWRSDWKWERITPHRESLKGKFVADIGCHNGYYMFRMLPEKPRLVIGFEPYAKHFWHFQLFQNLVKSPALHYELLGVEHIDFYPRFFDTIFCLGIIYHHTDPVSLLRKMHKALRPSGEIIIDCQGIPGELPISLTPRTRYAKARAIWFLPTFPCLKNWMARAGFEDIECFFGEPLSTEEQRRTPWADIPSLEDFLDPDDPTLTVEGYPAPWRYYVRAKRR